MHTKRYALTTVLTLLLASSAASAQKPNIVYIMADDLGYGSLNSYGAPTNLINTPNIDRLATEGMRFTHASTPSAVCSPTRYGVLMGEYPFRSDRQWGVVNINDRLLPDDEQQTMADWLQGQGYSTAAIGKWHLGFQDQSRSDDFTEWFDPLDPGPRSLGFDYFFGIPHNHDDRTGAYIENESVYQLQSTTLDPNPGISSYGNEYFGFDVPEMVLEDVTPELGNRAADWIEQQAGNEEPFFLYFNPIAVHQPITPAEETSAAGPYGDFIEDLDDSVGTVLDKLDELGIADDTLVVFTSDNGGQIPGDTSLEEWEAINAGLDLNGVYKGDKQTVWEGGTRVPFLARLPGTIEAGAVTDHTIGLGDSWATFADLVDPDGLDPFAEGAGGDSVSFLDALLDADVEDDGRGLVTASNQGVLALRRNGWKYIEGEQPEGSTQTPRTDEVKEQMYDLNVDPDESNDLLNNFPEIAQLLDTELDMIKETSSSVAPATGDLNADGAFDAADFNLFIAGWRSDTSGMAAIDMHAAGDLNLDGTTDFGDWALLRAAFEFNGAPASAMSLFNVPEPHSFCLGLAALAALIRRRR